MDRVYKRLFSALDDTEFVMPAGEQAMCFALDYPNGEITSVVVQQLTGNPVPFVIDLFDRQVCELGVESSESSEALQLAEALAKVIPTQTAVAGAAVELFQPQGYVFHNREGTLSVPLHKLYLRITVGGGAPEQTTWEAAIACRPAVA